jgi:hypothetical protein
MNFLNLPDFLCLGPKTITPIIPEIIGLPPTHPTAKARLSENHGVNMKDKTIDIPLNIPK